VQGTFVTLAAAQLLDDKALWAYATDRQRRFARTVDETGSFAEYNSPTYANVTIVNLTRIRMFVKDAEVLALNARLHDRIWRHLAEHWHVPTLQLAGPMSRCYSTDIGSPLWLQKALGGRLPFATLDEIRSRTAGVAGETGIMHGTRLTSLNTWKGTPNVVAPGKRPRVTLSPTLVLQNGNPVVAIAVAGGDMQDEAALQLLLDYVHFGMSADEAFRAPRVSTYHFITSFGQGRPKLGSLQADPRVAADVIEELKKRQHDVTVSGATNAWPAIIVLDPAAKMAFDAGSASGKLE
jgi:hypothetical protein